MGYVVPNFQNPTPSFYLLEDDNILAVSIRVHSIVQNTRAGSKLLVNSTTDCYAFTKQRKQPPQHLVSMSPSIVKPNVKFKVLLEKFNPLRLSNDTTLNVKTVLGQANKMNTRTIYGEPVYSVAANPVFNVDE